MSRKIYGWVGRILRVDLGSGRIWSQDTMPYAQGFIGGRGIAARIAWEELKPGIDAFDPENRLIFMTGPLTGTLAPSSGRTIVCSVSPRIYPKPWYTRSTFGGYWGPELKYSGFDGIVIQGASDRPVYIWIEDGRAEILDAKELWGKGAYATQMTLKRIHGDEAQVACIGPAGENLVRFSTIEHNLTNAAGQVGFGAVMGSKRLKAIALRGKGGIRIADPKRFLKVCRYVKERALPGWMVLRTKPSPERIQCTQACTAPCGAVMYKNMRRVFGEGFINAMPLCNDCNWFGEPERGLLVHYEGNGLRVKGYPGFDEATAVELTSLCEDLGLCTWILQTMAPWLIKCVEDGIEEIEGLKLDPLNPRWWWEFLHRISRREGAGGLFAEDLIRVADKLNLNQRVARFQMFAWGAPAHRDSRQNDRHPSPGYIVTALQWALASRDPFNSEHSYTLLQSFIDSYNRGEEPRLRKLSLRLYGTEKAFDRDTYEGKAQVVVFDGNRSCVKDSLLLCDWIFPRLLASFEDEEAFKRAEDITGDTSMESILFSAATGIDISEAELDRVGERIYNLERMILVREGRSRKMDETVIPHFKLPDRYDRTRLDEEKFRRLLEEYYQLRGWDVETGIPTKRKLEELGLRDVAEGLKG
ncbi:MAG: aldehyde ferredoxin oxidoreductase N-terminal domain-containing protein [Candidatus Bathyarchaeia archaeon]